MGSFQNNAKQETSTFSGVTTVKSSGKLESRAK